MFFCLPACRGRPKALSSEAWSQRVAREALFSALTARSAGAVVPQAKEEAFYEARGIKRKAKEAPQPASAPSPPVTSKASAAAAAAAAQSKRRGGGPLPPLSEGVAAAAIHIKLSPEPSTSVANGGSATTEVRHPQS